MLAWVVGCVLLGLGALLCFANWMIVVTHVRTRKRLSLLPFGGSLALAGCSLVPAIGWRIGLVALAIDPMTLLLVTLPVLLVRERVRRRST